MTSLPPVSQRAGGELLSELGLWRRVSAGTYSHTALGELFADRVTWCIAGWCATGVDCIDCSRDVLRPGPRRLQRFRLIRVASRVECSQLGLLLHLRGEMQRFGYRDAIVSRQRSGVYCLAVPKDRRVLDVSLASADPDGCIYIGLEAMEVVTAVQGLTSRFLRDVVCVHHHKRDSELAKELLASLIANGIKAYLLTDPPRMKTYGTTVRVTGRKFMVSTGFAEERSVRQCQRICDVVSAVWNTLAN